jgi:hypothetical protein
LGRLKKPSALPFAALYHPPWDYGIVFALRRDTAVAPGGGRSFYSCTYPSGWPIEGGDYGYVYIWLDPQRMCYGSGYGSLRSMAVLALRLTEPTPLVSSSSVGMSAWVGALANIVHNIRRGSSSPPSGRHGRSLTTAPDLPQLLRLGMKGLERIAFSPQLQLRPGGGYAGFGPARWRQRRGEWSQLPKAEVILAVSLVLCGGGFFIAYTQHKQSDSISSRSCCPWRWLAQVTASQRFLAPRPISETPVGECPGRR